MGLNLDTSLKNQHDLEIQELSSIHHFRTEIPNIIFDMDLDTYEFKTYCILKKTAGDKGVCFKSSKTLCEEIKCSLPKFIEVKQKLAIRGLITIQKRKHENGSMLPDLITIVDIWGYNMKTMLDKYPPKFELGGTKPNLGGVLNEVKGSTKPRLDKEEHIEEEHIEQQQEPLKFPIKKSNITHIISSAAAVSLESSEEKTKTSIPPVSKQLSGNSGKLKPPIHENLEKVPIPKHDKIEITKRYDEKTVLHALEWAFHPQTIINKDLAAAIKWACKIKPEIPKTKKTEIKKIPDYVSANRTVWRWICDAMKKLPRICDFREIGEYIEIPNGKLHFKDASFIDQVENFFRKQDVMTPTLKTYMKKMKGEFLNLCS